jgi:uncharacterized lipoprotein YmbA
MNPHFQRNFFIRLLVVIAFGVTAGCSILSPKPDLARSYRLDVLPEKISPAPPPDATLALAVFPVDIAGYLDRPQMVTVVNGGQVNLDEYHRWAEPLESGFSRVLAGDIELFADSTHVAAFPMAPGFGQEFEVYAQVLQFDGVQNGSVTLRVSWRITGYGGRPNFAVHETTFTRRVETGADPAESYVEALNSLVGDLAREIVGAVPAARAAKAAQTITSH